MFWAWVSLVSCKQLKKREKIFKDFYRRLYVRIDLGFDDFWALIDREDVTNSRVFDQNIHELKAMFFTPYAS